MDLQDPLIVGLASAAGGALVTGLVARWLERRKRDADRIEERLDGMLEKIHQLETRMAVLDARAAVARETGEDLIRGEVKIA